MKKSEKIISAILTMAFGILLIALRSKFIGLLFTVAGIGLIILGLVDLFQKAVPPAIVKLVIGVIVIIFGWGELVKMILYIVAAILLIVGALSLYDKIKHRICHAHILYTIMEYAVPCIPIVIGLLLLFHQNGLINFVFVASGILTVLEGGLLLARSVYED